MSSFSNRRPIERMHSASELVSSGSFASPLAQLSLSGGSGFAASRPRQDQHGNDVPPVPPLNLNLFRTPSVYSVDSTTSLDSLSTISADEHAFNTDPESPSTPRAVQHDQSDYFAQQASAGPSSGPSLAAPGGPLTPKRNFVITSRQASPAVIVPESKGGTYPYHRSPVKAPAHLHRDGPEPHQREEAIRPDDLESVHGEQGSDWGEDEQNFEWLDTDTAEAQNGDGRRLRSSPSKKLGAKMKAAVATAGEGSKKLRKPLVFPRRAAPPPPKDTAPAPPTHSPRVQDGSLPSSSHATYPAPTRRDRSADTRPSIPRGWTEGSVSASSSTETLNTTSRNYRQQPRAPLMVPTMVPMRSDDGPSSSSATMDRAGSKGSHLSMQSAAYSFYDLDSPGPSTPRATTPTASRRTPVEQVFPQGKYHKIPVSRLDRERGERERSISEPNRTVSDIDNMPPEVLVAKGIEARGLGDLPKSAWLFMKAAEGGSATGRMYWGLALRHGWGVAKDDRKAFAELRQACDESLAEGGLDFHQSPGAVKLTLQQKRALTRDLSLGMFEIANCFLEGVGAKKAPDVALSYLRFAGNLGDIAAQEQLGFLLSKGGNGIKKDMKEAAKWYRMAIGQGSSNTFGLAWVWKEKYMY